MIQIQLARHTVKIDENGEIWRVKYGNPVLYILYTLLKTRR